MNSIEVSIICNAYNHEKYIREALDGFVMQITTFAFEVLIHDDASSDKTADIIKEYEIMYPDLIKPIYSVENQYSKQDGSLTRIQYGRVKGKYIAICEGDDYWTDPYKLQKQYDALEKNPDINICAHAAKLRRNDQFIGEVAPSQDNTIFSVEEVISGGGRFVPTVSLMYRKTVLNHSIDLLSILNLDYSLQIQGSLPHGMLYLKDVMSVYRLFTEGSWTARMKSDTLARISHLEKVEKMLLRLDEGTGEAYHDIISDKINNNRFRIAILGNEYKKILSNDFRENFEQLPWQRKILTYIGFFFPKLADSIIERGKKNESKCK